MGMYDGMSGIQTPSFRLSITPTPSEKIAQDKKKMCNIRLSVTQKISLVLSIPLIILLVMTIVSLTGSLNTQNAAKNVQKAIGKY